MTDALNRLLVRRGGRQLRRRRRRRGRARRPGTRPHRARRSRPRRQDPRRPQPQRPDRDPDPALPARPRPRSSRTAVVDLDRRDRLRRRRRIRMPPCRAAPTCSTPSRCCSPTTCSPTPGRWCATSSGCATGRARAAASPYGSGALAGTSLALDPELVARELGLTSVSENSIDATSSRDVVAEFAYIAAQLGIDLSRFAEEIILCNTPRVRLRHARRRLLDRVVDHAAEEEPRHRRARPRQGRPAHRQPHRPAGHAQGAPARVQPRPAGGQGAGVRRRRAAGDGAARRSPEWCARCASTRSGWPSWPRRDSPWRRMSRSGSSRRASRSARRTRSAVRSCSSARRAA